MNTPVLAKIAAIGFIMWSGILSWLIANLGIDEDKMELGALANDFIPPIIAIASLLLFVLVDLIIPKIRFWTMLVLILINVLFAIELRIGS